MANSYGQLNHYGAVRTRVTGSGNLQAELMSMDEVNVNTLPTIPMQATTNREILVLANFNDQRASLHLFTDQINEVFQISRITIFTRPVATGYPQ